ncbi:MAG: hypothetical protein ACTSU5_20760 [Promethearchaeota archaeon]
MSKKKAILAIAIAASLVLAVYGGALYFSSKQTGEAPTVRVDFTGRPVTSLGDLGNGTVWTCYRDYVLVPNLESEMPHEKGNIYAPEIVVEGGVYKMWYGGQSSAGHDAIHFATSTDGVSWTKHGVAIPTGENNHVNDPSVVKVGNTYYMYYTVAPEAELDQVWCATSTDAVSWEVKGPVLLPSDVAGVWDSLKVGRPSVLYVNGMFEMWFDGTQEASDDPGHPEPGTGRHVGYASSSDGLHWTKWPGNPVFNNSGAVDVELIDSKYVVVEESGSGVFWRTGTNQTNFQPARSLLFANTGTEFDGYGHVTPFILVLDGAWVTTYTGAATLETWNGNRVDAWFPTCNISLALEGGASTGLHRRAASRGLVQWSLAPSLVGTKISLELHAGASALASATSTLGTGHNDFFLLEDPWRFTTIST